MLQRRIDVWLQAADCLGHQIVPVSLPEPAIKVPIGQVLTGLHPVLIRGLPALRRPRHCPAAKHEWLTPSSGTSHVSSLAELRRLLRR